MERASKRERQSKTLKSARRYIYINTLFCFRVYIYTLHYVLTKRRNEINKLNNLKPSFKRFLLMTSGLPCPQLFLLMGTDKASYPLQKFYEFANYKFLTFSKHVSSSPFSIVSWIICVEKFSYYILEKNPTYLSVKFRTL